MTDDHISRIRAALEAGPTPGPWLHEEWGSRILDSGEGSGRLLIAQVATNTWRNQGRHNADFIAACNPVAIRALLDRLKAAEAENIEADATVTRDETVRMLADTLQAVRTERDRLRQIAYDAATSLESISKLAGLAQYMDTMSDIRAYARSRADFARVALENTNG